MNQEKGTAEKEALRNASVWKTLLRILVYLKDYRLQLVLALLMAVVTAVASVGGTYLLRSVINDAIVPLIGSESPGLRAADPDPDADGSDLPDGDRDELFFRTDYGLRQFRHAAAAADRHVFQGRVASDRLF